MRGLRWLWVFWSFVISFLILDVVTGHLPIYMIASWSLAWACWTLAILERGDYYVFVIALFAGLFCMLYFLVLAGADLSYLAG